MSIAKGTNLMKKEMIVQMLTQRMHQINEQRHIHALKSSMVSLLPFLIILGLFTILQRSIELFPEVEIYDYGIWIVLCFLVVGITTSLAKHFQTSVVGCGSAVALLCVWYVVKMDVHSPLNGFAPMGLIALFGAECFGQASSFTWKNNHIPQAVCDYMSQLVPYIVTLLFGGILLWMAPTWANMVQEGFLFIVGFMDHWFTMVCIIAMICLCWISGFHGVALISTIARPFWFYMALANFSAYGANAPIPYIAGEGLYQWFVWIGGSGATMGLVLDLLLLGKSKHGKQLAKQTLSGSMFNINEMVIFGTDLMHERRLMIPFLATPIVLSILSYGLIAAGILRAPVLLMPWVLPAPVGALLACGLDPIAPIVSISCIIISMLLYLPFVLSYDRT